MTATVAVCNVRAACRDDHEHLACVKMVQYVHAVPCFMCSAAANTGMRCSLVLSVYSHVIAHHMLFDQTGRQTSGAADNLGVLYLEGQHEIFSLVCRIGQHSLHLLCSVWALKVSHHWGFWGGLRARHVF